MTSIKRRTFLQGLGGALGALGLSQFGLEHQAVRYGQVLAQSTPRKLALLVGINNYAALGTTPLFGPVNDIDLQYQLLVHRFGFSPTDIRVLTNEDATREAILQHYEEHLINQARPGDVVVFHFSGHGGQVRERDVCDDPNFCLNSTLVPYDAGSRRSDGKVEEIMGHTRFLMDSKFATDSVTLVLDCCYSGGGKRGNVIMRSRLTDEQARTHLPPQISPDELAYQQQWLSRLNWTEDDFITKRQAGIAKGVVITSAQRDQKSADYPFEGFYAGAFTYLLTRYLWQETGSQPVSQVIKYVSRSTRNLSEHSQLPEYEPLQGDMVDQGSFYQIPHVSPPGEAVVTKVAGSQLDLWLGGLDFQSLAAFDQGATFTLLTQQGQIKGSVEQIGKRNQLTAQGNFTPTSGETPQVGDILQETVRGIPEKITLKVGLDPSLGTDLGSVAEGLKRQMDFLEVHPVQAGESVHCFLGRVAGSLAQAMTEPGLSAPPAGNSVGLFKAMADPIPGSFGPVDELVETAIVRLQPIFKSLLVGRMLRLMLNGPTSRLKVELSLQIERGEGDRGIPILATTPRSRSGEDVIIPQLAGDGVETIPLDARLRLKIQNSENRDLYMSLLVIDAHGTVDILYPNNWDAPEDQSLVKAGDSINFPTLKAVPPIGLTELLVVASSAPLRQSLKALQRTVPSGHRGSVTVSDPDEMMGALFADLGTTRRGSGTPSANSPRYLDTSRLAALSLLYQVVEAEYGDPR